MAEIEWQTIKKQYCERVGKEVSLDAQVVLPSEHLPDLTSHVIAHRCSLGLECAINHLGECVWSGGNPDYDPFQEDAKSLK